MLPIVQHRLRSIRRVMLLGLVLEGVALVWSDPVMFLIFLAAGSVCLGGGLFAYLWVVFMNMHPPRTL